MRKTLIGLAAAALIAVGCSAAPDEPAGIPADVAADAGVPSASPAKRDPNTITTGTWEVGTEVKPGTYIATAETHCYWARLRNLDGELTSIIANGNLSPGQRGRITVKKSDKGLELNGDCTWVRDRK